MSDPMPARKFSVTGAAAGAAFGLLGSPFRSKLFLLATLVTLAGGAVIASAAIKGQTPDAAWAPWALRIGASFVAAFVFAFLVRRAVMFALFVGGLLVGGAILINKLGLGFSQDQIAGLEDQVTHGAEQVQHAADSAWTTVKGYLPSGGAAGFGLYRGARHSGPPKQG